MDALSSKGNGQDRGWTQLHVRLQPQPACRRACNVHKQPLHVIQHPSGGRHGLPPRPVFGGCRILTTGAARGWRMGPAKILTIGHKKLSASCAPYSFIAHAFEPPECHTCNGLRQQAEQLMGTDRCSGVTAIQCCRTSEVARPKQRCAGTARAAGPRCQATAASSAKYQSHPRDAARNNFRDNQIWQCCHCY